MTPSTTRVTPPPDGAAPEQRVTAIPARVSIDFGVRGALVAVMTIAAVWLLLELWQVLLVIVVGLMLVGTLNPFVEKLEARGLKRSYGIAVVFGLLFVAVGALIALTLPRFVTQASGIAADLPKLQARLADHLASWKIAAPLAERVRGLDGAAVASTAAAYVMPYGKKAMEIGAYAASAFFLALYTIIDRDRMRGSLFAVVPRRHHLRLSRVLLNLEIIVGGYVRGQAITSLLMAVVTFLVLTIAGVPDALALAVFAGVVDVLPYIGALLACAPAFVAALPQGFTVALVVLAILAGYQELESRVIVPRVYGRVLRLPSATILVALLVGGKLLGILGAVLALPIAAGIRMVIEELRVELPGEDVDHAAVRAKDAVEEAVFEVRAAGLPAQEAAAIATEIVHDRQVAEAQQAGDDAKKAHSD